MNATQTCARLRCHLGRGWATDLDAEIACSPELRQPRTTAKEDNR